MFVAASTRCFADLPLDAALQRLVDLEYTCVEIMIHESRRAPEAVGGAGRSRRGGAGLPADAPAHAHRLQRGYRPARFRPRYYDQFAACCKLAKASKVVTITVRSAELGTPYNAEVERLRTMVAIASLEGVRVGLLTEAGRMTQDPGHGGRLVRQRQGPGPDARSQPLHLRPASTARATTRSSRTSTTSASATRARTSCRSASARA